MFFESEQKLKDNVFKVFPLENMAHKPILTHFYNTEITTDLFNHKIKSDIRHIRTIGGCQK